MGPRFIVDSNVVIDFLADRIPNPGCGVLEQLFDSDFNISVVTKIEVLGYAELPDKMPQVEQFLSRAQVMFLDENICARTIYLRRTYRKLRLGDAIIAATALEGNYSLITRNVDDFARIAGLEVMNPYHIAA